VQKRHRGSGSVLVMATIALAAVSQSAAALAPVWEYHAGTACQIQFSGTADVAGNLYWIESCPGSAGYTNQLVAARSDGTVRYRTPIAAGIGPLTLSGAVIVYQAGYQSDLCFDYNFARLEARAISDGHLLWSRDPVADVRSRYPVYPGGSAVTGCGSHYISRPATGNGYVAVTAMDQSDRYEPRAALVALEAATGVVIGMYQVNAPTGPGGVPGDPMVDVDGNVYALVHSKPTGSQVLSITFRGDLRFLVDEPDANSTSRQAPTFDLLAVYKGWLVEGGYSQAPSSTRVKIRSSATGALMVDSRVYAAVPVLSGNKLRFIGCFSESALCPEGVSLYSVDLARGTLDWVRPLTTDGSAIFASPILTSAGTLVLAQQTYSRTTPEAIFGPAQLREFDAAGNEVYQAALPDTQRGGYGGYPVGYDLAQGYWNPMGDSWDAAIAGGNWVVTGYASGAFIRAFPLPGRTIAPSGWITPRGTQYRANRPR